MLWDQWTVSTLINTNPSKFTHFYFHQTHDFTFFVLWDHQQGTQARYVHLVIYSVAYLKLYLQLSGDLKPGLMEKAMKLSGGQAAENWKTVLLASWENEHNGHVMS